MIRVLIERITTSSRTVSERVCVSEKPTEFKDSTFGNREVAYERQYEVVDSIKWDTNTQVVLKQEFEDDEKFSLRMAAVIKALNGL